MNRYGLFVSICCVIGVADGSCGLAQQSSFNRQLSIAEVVTALADDQWVVVDARSTDAYNGWALDEIEQGGHIPGAVDFPADWIRVDVPQRAELLAKILRNKQIAPTNKVVVYSSQRDDRQRVAKFLRQRNYKEVYSFDLGDWLESKRDLRRYPQYQRLLPPAIVKQLLDGEATGNI